MKTLQLKILLPQSILERGELLKVLQNSSKICINNNKKISSELIKSQNAKVFFPLTRCCRRVCVSAYVCCSIFFALQTKSKFLTISECCGLSLSLNIQNYVFISNQTKEDEEKLNDLSMASLWRAIFRCWRGMLENFYLPFLRQSFCHHQNHKHEGIIVFTLFSFSVHASQHRWGGGSLKPF